MPIGLFCLYSRQRPTLPQSHPCSTIGAGGLNFRVRNGNGCGPSARVTGKLDLNIWQLGALRAMRQIDFALGKFYGQASRPISTRKLRRLLVLHIGPINLVVYQGPSGTLRSGRSHLEVGFALICFQRLSLPNVTTERCSWRNNS